MGWHEQETPAGGAATRGHIPQTFHRPHTHVTSKRSHAKPIAALFTAGHVLPSLRNPPRRGTTPSLFQGLPPSTKPGTWGPLASPSIRPRDTSSRTPRPTASLWPLQRHAIPRGQDEENNNDFFVNPIWKEGRTAQQYPPKARPELGGHRTGRREVPDQPIGVGPAPALAPRTPLLLCAALWDPTPWSVGWAGLLAPDQQDGAKMIRMRETVTSRSLAGCLSPWPA